MPVGIVLYNIRTASKKKVKEDLVDGVVGLS